MKIYKHNLKQFASNQRIANEPSVKPIYHYRTVETVGGGFSGISSGISSVVNLIKNNKDLITSAAKGAAAIGSTASAISNAVKSHNELKQLEAIRRLRDDAKELEKEKRKKLSEETKNRIANLSVEEIRGNGIAKF